MRVTAAGEPDPAFGGGDGFVDVPSDLNEFDVLPLPSGGYLGLGHAVTIPSTTSAPPLVAIVYDDAGGVVSSTQIDVFGLLPTLPAGTTGWTLGARLHPTPSGVAAVEVASTTPEGTDFLVSLSREQHFDGSGQVVDSPSFAGPGGLGSEAVSGRVELADGRVVEAVTTVTIILEVQQVLTASFLRARLADGSPDLAFGSGGSVALQIPNGGRLAPAALAATNGERFLVVVGETPSGAAYVARYDAATGALDPTFGNAGGFGVALDRVESVVERAGSPQLYLGGYDDAGRPAVARVWNHAT